MYTAMERIYIIIAIILIIVGIMVAYATWWWRTQTIELIPVSTLTTMDLTSKITTLIVTATLPAAAKPLGSTATTANWTAKTIEIRGASLVKATILSAMTTPAGPVTNPTVNTPSGVQSGTFNQTPMSTDIYPEIYTITISPAPSTPVQLTPSSSIRVMLTDLY